MIYVLRPSFSVSIWICTWVWLLQRASKMRDEVVVKKATSS